MIDKPKDIESEEHKKNRYVKKRSSQTRDIKDDLLQSIQQFATDYELSSSIISGMLITIAGEFLVIESVTNQCLQELAEKKEAE